ncbi:MAG: hypothetical protein AAB776_03655 [Patescibacteria group bacterium]
MNFETRELEGLTYGLATGEDSEGHRAEWYKFGDEVFGPYRPAAYLKIIDRELAICGLKPDGSPAIVIKGRERPVDHRFELIWALSGTDDFWSCAAGARQDIGGQLIDRDYVIVNGTVYGPLVCLEAFEHHRHQVKFYAMWYGDPEGVHLKWTTVNR